MDQPSWHYDRAEMLADGVIHVIGVALALAGAVVLVAVTLWRAETVAAIAASIYALTLVATLSMSAVYNMWPVCPLKWKLRKYDHAAIFLLIAGTWTPFALQAGATAVLLAVWVAAGLGIFLKIAFPGRFDRLALVLYIGLGWSGAAVIETMFDRFSPTVWLLLIGGIVYTVGIVFHFWHRLRYQNAIWHGFVLAGAAVHYSAVMSGL